MSTNNFCFYLQNRQIQVSQTGGQWYNDTSPFSIPCLMTMLIMTMLMTLFIMTILMTLFIMTILIMAILIMIILIMTLLIMTIMTNYNDNTYNT